MFGIFFKDKGVSINNENGMHVLASISLGETTRIGMEMFFMGQRVRVPVTTTSLRHLTFVLSTSVES